MKILSISDIHGLNLWKGAVMNPQDVDHIVFLGDYVDSFTIPDDRIISNLQDIITFKLMNPTKVTLLLGNHDINYMRWIPGAFHGCSGYRYSYADTLLNLFQNNFEHFQIAVEFGSGFNKVLYTHAGLNQRWIDKYFKPWCDDRITDIKDDATIADKLNDLLVLQDGLSTLLRIGRERGGHSLAGGPLWSHFTELLDEDSIPSGFHQVVGHNRIGHYMDKYDQLSNPPTSVNKNGFTVTFTDNLEEAAELNLMPYFHIHDTEDSQWKKA